MVISLLDPINYYCERTGPEFWSEPLNALSNIAFLIAAFLLYREYRRRQLHDCKARFFIALVAVIGVGSFLFHSFANHLTMWFDVVPIMLFVFAYLWVALRHMLHIKTTFSIAWLALFAVFAAQLPSLLPDNSFNGSLSYFPCLFALYIIAWKLKQHQLACAALVFKGALCFTASLFFRSIDYLVCPAFPAGTHFIWHCLNGMLLYLLVKAVMIHPLIKHCARRDSV